VLPVANMRLLPPPDGAHLADAAARGARHEPRPPPPVPPPGPGGGPGGGGPPGCLDHRAELALGPRVFFHFDRVVPGASPRARVSPAGASPRSRGSCAGTACPSGR